MATFLFLSMACWFQCQLFWIVILSSPNYRLANKLSQLSRDKAKRLLCSRSPLPSVAMIHFKRCKLITCLRPRTNSLSKLMVTIIILSPKKRLTLILQKSRPLIADFLSSTMLRRSKEVCCGLLTSLRQKSTPINIMNFHNHVLIVWGRLLPETIVTMFHKWYFVWIISQWSSRKISQV